MFATDIQPPVAAAPKYVAEIARDAATIREALALRHRVFAGEMGARLHSLVEGLDYEMLDNYCDHLLVRESTTQRVVACTRLLSGEQAQRFGRFYSESEFDLRGVLALPGRFLEIGRTCVDPDHRGSVVLSTLWAGLADYVRQGRFDYLMGCASIPPGPNGFAVDAVYRRFGGEHAGGEALGVRSLRAVPEHQRCVEDECGIPPLLLAYLRLGCKVLGDPYWDEDFNVMDVFILLDLSRLQARYERRFIAGRTVPNPQLPGLSA